MTEGAPAKVTVPREPTEEMYEAGRHALKQFIYGLSVEERKARYSKKHKMHRFTEREKLRIRFQAMLNAAAATPEPQDGKR